MVKGGESGIDPGVPGNVNAGDPPRSKECECDSCGVCIKILLAES